MSSTVRSLGALIMRYRLIVTILVAAPILMAGCSSGKTRDTATGAAVGAAAGAAIGSVYADAGKGAAIGAGIGGTGGYFLGDDEPNRNRRANRPNERVCARGYYLNQRGRCVRY